MRPTPTSPRRMFRGQRRLISLVALCFWLAACGEDEPAPSSTELSGTTESQEGSQTPEPSENAPPEAQPEEAGPTAESDRFELALTAAGPYTAGGEGQFTVELSPRGEWKINQLYPMRVELSAPSGVTLPSSELSKDDAATYDDHTAHFDVGFTANEAGDHRVSATVDFGVCIAERCMQELQTVAIVLPVEG